MPDDQGTGSEADEAVEEDLEAGEDVTENVAGGIDTMAGRPIPTSTAARGPRR